MADQKDRAPQTRTASAAGIHRSDWAIKGQQTKAEFQRAAAGTGEQARKAREKPGASHHREPPAHDKQAAGKEQSGGNRARFDRFSDRICQRQRGRSFELGR